MEQSRRNFSQAEHRSASWVWLVEVGHYRLATETLSVSVDGTDVLFTSGVVDVGWDREIDYQSLTFDEVVSVEAILPDTTLAKDGLARRRCKVSLIRRGDTYEDRRAVADGFISDPQYGAPEEPTRWGVRPSYNPETDTTRFPGALSMTAKYSSGLPLNSKGASCAWIYGSPGGGDYVVPAPIVSIEYTGGPTTYTRTTTLQVSANRLPEAYDASVTIAWVRTNEPFGALEQFVGTANTASNDETGATIEITDTVSNNGVTEGADYWVRILSSDPVLPIDTSNGVPTLGNLIRLLVPRMQARVDWSRMSEAANALDPFQVDFYINDPDAEVMEWFSTVGDVLGFAWATGFDGLFLLVRPDRDLLEHPRAALENRENAARLGTYSEPSGEVLTAYELEYGQQIGLNWETTVVAEQTAYEGGEVTRELITDTKLNVDGTASFWGAASDSLTPAEEGYTGDTVTEGAYYINDAGTARKVVSDQLYWRGFVHRTVQVELIDPSLADLDLGEIVTWTDDDWGISAETAYVSAVSVSLDRVVYTLSLLPR